MKKIDKQFGLTSFALNNRTSVIFLAFLIAVMGVVTYLALPKDSFPEIKQPTIYVGTSYPGNSPLDMENLVTRPIEKELNTISEVDKIRSTSVQDYSTIIIEFDPETNVEDALTKVKDAVDRAKPELPQDLPADPNVFELNFAEFPIMNINLSGNYSIGQLKRYAEYLEEEIEKVSEISKAEIRGVDEKEVKIKVDPYALEARKLNFSDIENAVKAENVTLSGGNLLNDGIRRNIRVVGEFDDVRQLEDIIVKHEKGDVVYLRDVATVEFNYKDPQSYARLGRQPVVMVDVIKRSGENLLNATEKVNAILEKAKKNVFPSDLLVTITNDQSSFTREMVSSLENNIISGVIVVVGVLMLFLGIRNAYFVGIAIPLSMFLSFIVLSAIGYNINMMVLFALIMGLGMLVDNGIVVVENVYRLYEEGYDLVSATKLGVGEIAWPIISSTATTLAAFLPLAMWPGIMGEFMKYLPITLIVVLSSSLFVALFITPVITSLFMKHEGEKTGNPAKRWRTVGILTVLGLVFIGLKIFWLGNLMLLFAILTLLNVYVFAPASHWFQTVFLPKVENRYGRLIEFALKGRNPVRFFIGTTFLLIFSVVMMGLFPPKVLFFPENEPKYINVFIEFPTGTDIEVTNQFTREIEDKVIAFLKPYEQIVESVTGNVGQGTSDPGDMSSMGMSDTPNKARITVNFKDFRYRNGISTSKVMEELRNALGVYPGVSLTVDKDSNGPPSGKPVSIEISGNDIATLIRLSEDIKRKINESGIQGIEKLKTDIETGKPELIVHIDRDMARRFGVSTYAIANEVRTSLFGKEISKFKQGEDDYKIQLRLDDKYRYDLDALMNKSITFRDQTSGRIAQVPISSVASAELTSSYGSVKRNDLKRVVTITSNVLGGYNPTEINKQIQEILADYTFPPGYTYKFTGEQEKQAEQMSFLTRAGLFAVFLIFLIIVAQFNKITAPLIIMTSVVFSTIGVFLGLLIFRMDFIVIMTMIGLISLAGVAVNNAIVLIDFIELGKKRYKEENNTNVIPKEEVLRIIAAAGKTRLRPVLLTAITTILGLIPLAVGINIDFIQFFKSYNANFYVGGDSVIFWGPLSWTIIYGLTFATFLTLVIVPVMYLLLEKLNRKLGIAS
ncbi:MAG: efflux RND transporter permease subunit [Cyclobacteriaceae bacterium]|nr:efflux RND transporter permease subunit [Cyclobacteriaceae bacterium]MDW8331786.1 efflux RND transporter permease subunit [Cyclobacteriaceae bacterium]